MQGSQNNSYSQRMKGSGLNKSGISPAHVRKQRNRKLMVKSLLFPWPIYAVHSVALFICFTLQWLWGTPRTMLACKVAQWRKMRPQTSISSTSISSRTVRTHSGALARTGMLMAIMPRWSSRWTLVLSPCREAMVATPGRCIRPSARVAIAR